MNKTFMIQYPFLRAMYLFLVFWIIGLSAILLLYHGWYFEYQRTWGATEEEINHYMPGDEVFDNPCFNTTRAVEIEAAPEEIWPWIAQMGWHRGGFYAFDKLDNGGVPSADVIRPEFQNHSVGDTIPLNEWKGELCGTLEILEITPKNSICWLFGNSPWEGATWSWRLYQVDDGRTRLVTRLRNHSKKETMAEKIMWTMADATEIFMMRTCLLGIKLRSEQLAEKRGGKK